MKYILMHRELPVAVLSINDTSGTVYRVEDVVQPAHLPIGLFSADRREFAKNLNLWLAGRTIPASRSGFHHALEALQIFRRMSAISCLGRFRSGTALISFPPATPPTAG